MGANAREVELLDEIIEHLARARQFAAEGSHTMKGLHVLAAVSRLYLFVHPAAHMDEDQLMNGPAASDLRN